jgi:hypothetical protein
LAANPVDTLRWDFSIDRLAAQDRKGDPAESAADILVRPNLMIWKRAVYCTLVDPDSIKVCCAAPWFSFTCSAAWTQPAALLQG